MNELLTDQIFENHNFAENPLVADFEDCVFKSCVFAKANLSKLTFTNCTFENAIGALRNCTDGLSECEFSSCKMLGIAFETCNTFFSDLLSNARLILVVFIKLI